MSDLIDRQAAIDAMESAEWYHQNQNKDMVSGANSAEHQAWYKAEDVYKVLEQLPSAQPETHEERTETHGMCLDAISRQDAIDAMGKVQWAKVRLMELPSAQPELIRCADCKHYDTHDHRCKWWNHGVVVMDYCSRAERRTS